MKIENLEPAMDLLAGRIVSLDQLLAIAKERPDLIEQHPILFAECQRCRNTAYGLLVALEVMDAQFKEVADLSERFNQQNQ